MPSAESRSAAQPPHPRRAAPARAPRTLPRRSSLPPSPPLIEELRKALAAAERRIEELNERARIADAERNVAVARVNAENAQLREQLAVAPGVAAHRAGAPRRRRAPTCPSSKTSCSRAAIASRRSRQELAAPGASLSGRERAARARAQQRCEALDADVMNLRAAVARRDAQIAMLEADLTARQQREANAQPRGSPTRWRPPILTCRSCAASSPRATNRSACSRRSSSCARTHAAEKDQDLQVAEESIRNLEIEVRDKTGKLEEANVTVEEWRAVIAESQRSILQRDGRIQQLETDLEKRVAVARRFSRADRRGNCARRARRACSSAPTATRISCTCSAAARASAAAPTTSWCSIPSTSAAITRCCWRARRTHRSRI